MSLLLSTGAFASSLSGSAPGMVLVSPTSITHSGTSATLGANGQVTFTAVTSLSLNGCFTADFDNYVIAYRAPDNAAFDGLVYRLRASGSDASGSDYAEQRLRASSTSVTAGRSTSQSSARVASINQPMSGVQIQIYGPFLAQPTASRSVTADGAGGARIDEYANTHSLSTSYDGITFTQTTPNALSGTLAVYGIRS